MLWNRRYEKISHSFSPTQKKSKKNQRVSLLYFLLSPATFPRDKNFLTRPPRTNNSQRTPRKYVLQRRTPEKREKKARTKKKKAHCVYTDK